MKMTIEKSNAVPASQTSSLESSRDIARRMTTARSGANARRPPRRMRCSNPMRSPRIPGAMLHRVPLHPAIQGAAAQPQRLGRLAHVAFVARQRLADQERLDLFQRHVVDPWRAVAPGAQREVRGADATAGRHEDGALDGVIELADVARPWVRDQLAHRSLVEARRL